MNTINWNLRFENSVISYGSQTESAPKLLTDGFENSVISYGSQTNKMIIWCCRAFENSVISYGSQTICVFFYA